MLATGDGGSFAGARRGHVEKQVGVVASGAVRRVKKQGSTVAAAWAGTGRGKDDRVTWVDEG